MNTDLKKILEEKTKQMYRNLIKSLIDGPSLNISSRKEYEYVETEEVKRVREVAKKLPERKKLQEFENEYDELAHTIIQLHSILPKNEFINIIPSLDSEAVFYLLKRMNEVDRYNTQWNVEFNKKYEQLRPSSGRAKKAKNKWEPIKNDFYKWMEKYPDRNVTEVRRQVAKDHGEGNASDRTLGRQMPYPKN